jgi:hypothetical protein
LIELLIKKSGFYILILSIINSIVLTGIIIFLIICNHKPIDSSEIFKNNIDSVVEDKATTFDVGESWFLILKCLILCLT